MTLKKKMREENKRLKKQDKEGRKMDRKQNTSGSNLENMLAYVDEFGNLTSKPQPKN